jgi:hypothetical protein
MTIVELIATVCGPEGPTNHYREVLRVAVVDYGGNVYGHATTRRGAVRILRSLRIPARLQPVKLGNIVSAEAYHPDFTLDCGLSD